MTEVIGYYPNKGYVIHGDTNDALLTLTGGLTGDLYGITPALSVADPPYGDITDEPWDKADVPTWIEIIKKHESWRCPIYWWGGIGKQGYRPFLEFILEVERLTHYRMRDLITWKKKRAYGKPKDYLFIREECAFLTFFGNEVITWNTPYLTDKRGYSGYNAKYPAKSEYKRRGNIWEEPMPRGNVWDETELLKNKLHPTQKAPIVCQIPIETHTNPGDLVLDLYSGSGETSIQALKLGRRFIAIERDRTMAINLCKRIETYF
jgi:DNA modification methylase